MSVVNGPLARRNLERAQAAYRALSEGVEMRMAPAAPQVVSKGMLLGTELLRWDTPDGKVPHHVQMKAALSIDHPTIDVHFYSDNSFALWEHRGMVGNDPATVAAIIAGKTGAKWRGAPVEAVQGLSDKESDNPLMNYQPKDN